MLLWRHFGLQAIVKYITQIQLFKVLKIRLSSKVKTEVNTIRSCSSAFYLLQIYGSIPYITGTNYEINRKLRSSDGICSNAKDLESASSRLPENYSSSTNPIKWWPKPCWPEYIYT
jgi:hypothetical protein